VFSENSVFIKFLTKHISGNRQIDHDKPFEKLEIQYLCEPDYEKNRFQFSEEKFREMSNFLKDKNSHQLDMSELENS